MSTPFSCTLRSLNRSNNVLPQIGLFVALLLTLLWSYWFFGVSLLAYETSEEITITSLEDTIMYVPPNSVGAVRPQQIYRRTLIAAFPVNVLQHIQPGQPALLQLAEKGKAIPAVVVEIMDSPNLEKGLVKLHTLSEQRYPFVGNEHGKISIERQRGTPAYLVFRTLGLFTEMPPVAPTERYFP